MNQGRVPKSSWAAPQPWATNCSRSHLSCPLQLPSLEQPTWPGCNWHLGTPYQPPRGWGRAGPPFGDAPPFFSKLTNLGNPSGPTQAGREGERGSLGSLQAWPPLPQPGPLLSPRSQAAVRSGGQAGSEAAPRHSEWALGSRGECSQDPGFSVQAGGAQARGSRPKASPAHQRAGQG